MSDVVRDKGHFNCRDYTFTEDDAYTHAIRDTRPSNQESVVSGDAVKSQPFRIFDLPLELRQKIYLHVLPKADSRSGSTLGLLGSSSVKTGSSSSIPSIIWTRGQTSLLSACQQMHDECVAILYGCNVFVLFVTYSQIVFRFRFLIPSGLAPSRHYEFLDLVPLRYRKLVRQLVVTVDHPDSYTGMIKYNVGGRGLTHGLRLKVQELVDALQPRDCSDSCIRSLDVDLRNGNDHLDGEKQGIVRAREHEIAGDGDVQVVLEPFADLHRVNRARIRGAVTKDFANALRQSMMKVDC